MAKINTPCNFNQLAITCTLLPPLNQLKESRILVLQYLALRIKSISLRVFLFVCVAMQEKQELSESLSTPVTG